MQKRPITFFSWRFGLFIFINLKNPSHQRHPFSLLHLSFLGLISSILINPNQDKSQGKTKVTGSGPTHLTTSVYFSFLFPYI